MVWGFNTCGPNEAMVVSGCCYSHPYIIPGGRVFVWPGIQRIERLSLNTMTLTIESPRIYTQLGVPITVTGVAQVKISSGSEMLAMACENFLGKSEGEIHTIARETLEGHQRAIMGSMTVEEIYKDRKKFSAAVFEVANLDLAGMGMVVISYTITDIRDDNDYLHSLGLARTARVKCEARIGEAKALRDGGIRKAQAEKECVAKRCENDIEIARSKRDFELQNAEYQKEVETRRAESEMAYQLQAAKTKQKIKAEEMQVTLLERNRMIELKELEIEHQKNHLDATVKKPAEAERYRLEKLAEANSQCMRAAAEAEAETIKLRGVAKAEAIAAQAKADAELMAKNAEAMEKYGNAAKLAMTLDTVKKIAAELSIPLTKCNKITMVSTGDGDVGVAKLTNELLTIMDILPKTVGNLTGTNVLGKVNT